MTTSLPPRAAAALDELLAGNRRYAEDRPHHPHVGRGTRATLAAGQHPLAAVLACSDSRVPPTLVFDQGLGDLFVVRNAGQVLSPDALASLEYAVLELDVPLIAVLGHQACGAIRAAAATFGGDGIPEGHLAQVLAPLAPPVAFASRRIEDADDLDALADLAGRTHVRMTVAALRRAGPVIATRVADGRLAVVGLRYELASGRAQPLEAGVDPPVPR
jgi:carbonic anhydrase